MNAARFHQIADDYGAPAEERDHALANARWDLKHLPETVHGRDVYEIAADALTAARARPVRPPLPKVRFPYHAWTPGNLVGPRGWPPAHDPAFDLLAPHLAPLTSLSEF